MFFKKILEDGNFRILQDKVATSKIVMAMAAAVYLQVMEARRHRGNKAENRSDGAVCKKDVSRFENFSVCAVIVGMVILSSQIEKKARGLRLG